MKKIIALLFAALAFSAVGLRAEEAEEAATVLSKQYSYKDFQALSVGNSFKVTLVQDSKWSVEVEYSDFLEQYLDVEVRAGTLRIALRSFPDRFRIPANTRTDRFSRQPSICPGSPSWP